MSDVAIKVEGLGKQYRIAHKRPNDTLKEAVMDSVGGLFRRKSNGHKVACQEEVFWALKDVSFEVKKGEVLGIIGRNGAGKSTLLKILSRITEMTEGAIDIFGRVGSLLEVGTGFHPELTGRENIFLNGAIMGMLQREVRRKFDEIVDFAEIEKFLDTPVKHYSSGMYTRLAFAVAAHLEPEILIVDEVLAVGDPQFQKKCLGKISDAAAGGRTILLVSHNMGSIASLCNRCIYLVGGRVDAIGRCTEVIEKSMGVIPAAQQRELELFRLKHMSKAVRFIEISARSSSNSSFPQGAPLDFDLTVESSIHAVDLSIGASIFNLFGACVGTLFSKYVFSLRIGERRSLRLAINPGNLAPGRYRLGVGVGYGGISTPRVDYDIVIGTPEFEVRPIKCNGEVFSDWQSAWGHILFEGNVDMTLESPERMKVST